MTGAAAGLSRMVDAAKQHEEMELQAVRANKPVEVLREKIIGKKTTRTSYSPSQKRQIRAFAKSQYEDGKSVVKITKVVQSLPELSKFGRKGIANLLTAGPKKKRGRPVHRKFIEAVKAHLVMILMEKADQSGESTTEGAAQFFR